MFAKHKIHLGGLDQFVRNANFLDNVESKAPDASYMANAHAKCFAAFRAAKMPTLADDSGIEIEALNGEPGVHSAHYAKPGANQSQTAANNQKVLDALKGKSNRKARMRSVLVFMLEGMHLEVEAVCEGKIAEKPAGTAGFGYDTIFIPDAGNGKTFAEMSAAEKNAISHRALAVDKLVKLLGERDIELVRP